MLARSFLQGIKNATSSLLGWYISVILAYGRLKQEDHEFKTSLGYIGKFSRKAMPRKHIITWIGDNFEAFTIICIVIVL
jgi:hypothetical protein